MRLAELEVDRSVERRADEAVASVVATREPRVLRLAIPLGLEFEALPLPMQEQRIGELLEQARRRLVAQLYRR
jgi:hypothetical protein